MKVIKWLAILSFTSISIVVLYWVGFALLFSYGAGGPKRIEAYDFKTTEKNLRKELTTICSNSNYLSYKDTIDDNGFTKTLVTIQITEESNKTVYDLRLWNMGSDEITSFYLYYINSRSSDYFGWFSFEKYKKVKLFEKEIIEPLSKKFERVE
ncbi:hypothetical protein [Flavobacterium pectinovorum]|uniref:DUF4359 domain-containing protein n=1 Tax=Flavobacterium pectinovorum TaxID=29533 RepID=A0AB36P0B6_9FLAO|nr:hypothetical protein [Flavobacterium pectinovorum]OXB04647.1 hypothetical protein B0A72_11750 [Flavobacterium pectinovorum]WKL47914.1 hypothetical protein Q1W71_23565 [Flavobacterium pectinovorum]SHL25342.1 hypothetical protein SAMN05444387_0144 [Flavobacterium pectinovorum]